MAIAFRDSAAVSSSGTPVSIVLPSTIVQGDALLMVIANNGTPTDAITAPSGWTLVSATTLSSSNHGLLKKIATSADAGATITLTWSTNIKSSIVMVAYSGTDLNEAVNAFSKVSETVSGTTHTTPNVATTQDNCWIVELLTEKGSTNTAWTVPGAVTKRVDTYGTGTGAASAVIAGIGADQVTGTYGNHAYTTTDTSSQAVMYTVALSPKVLRQYARPNTDVATSGWTPVPVVSPAALDIGESSRDDSTYIQSGSAPTSSVLNVGLSTVADPGPTNHTGYQVQYVLSTAGGATTSTVVVDLMENTTVRATWTETTIPALSGGLGTLYTHTLTDPQCASITDYTALRLRFTATAS